MSYNFWFYYTFAFVFIFPLIFSFAGNYNDTNPWVATISLIAGAILWIIFIFRIYKTYFRNSNTLYNEAKWLQKSGKLVDAKIVEIISKKNIKNNYSSLELEVEFYNLAGTKMRTVVGVVDTKPHLKRFEEGNSLSLRLNTRLNNIQLPWIMADGEIGRNEKSRKWLFPFTIIYAVATFLIFYKLQSQGEGWRWLSPFHPWVWTPLFGLFAFGIISSISKRLGGKQDSKANELLLHGIETTGKITKARQTGTFINEQPEMRISVNFIDQHGEKHHTELKQVVMLTNLHNYQEGEKRLIYLPTEPTEIMFVD